MSHDPSPNPYDAPTFADLPYAPPGKPPRSGWLVAVCVIAIALGGLGTLKAAGALIALPFQNQLQTAFTPARQPGMPAEFQDAQNKLQAETQDVQKRYLVASVGLAMTRLAIALSLVYGGVMCLKQTQAGKSALTYAFVAAIVFEIADAVVQTIIFREMLEVMMRFTQEVVDNTPRGNGPPPELLTTIMRGAMWAGMGIHYLIQLAKVIFYALGFMYLRRSDVAAQFEPPRTEEPVAATPA